MPSERSATSAAFSNGSALTREGRLVAALRLIADHPEESHKAPARAREALALIRDPQKPAAVYANGELRITGAMS